MSSVTSRCACGREHCPPQTQIHIKVGALQELPRMAAAYADGAPLVLFDNVIHPLLGNKIEAAFLTHDKPWHRLVVGPREVPMEPDEHAIHQVRMAVERHRPGLLVGVGSGSMNDLAKYVARESQLPYISVATAPSMDGYMSPISALLIGGVKVSRDAKVPDAILADLDVLAEAPLHLISAGYADVLAKLTALRDWEMAHIILDEYWCKGVSDDVERTASSLYRSVDALAQRSHDSVRLLMEGLLDAGISVAYVGNSRPTSGSEHLISHYIEMRSLKEGKRPPAHGHSVGFGMLVISELVQRMVTLTADDVRKAAFTTADPTKVLLDLRFDTTPDNFGTMKFDPSARDARIEQVAARWDAVLEVLRKVPAPDAVQTSLRRMHAPTNITELGIDSQMALGAVLHARYIRERYTMLDLAADLGVLGEEAEEIVRRYA